MTCSIESLINARSSVVRYQQERPVDTQIIQQLAELATRAPSAFNMQNWHLLAVQSPDSKRKLHHAAYQQPQILQAPATFIICGTLNAHRTLADTLQPSISSGLMPEQIAASWVDAARGLYEGRLQAQRDEAIRSASMAAMTLVLAAEGMGLNTGAVGGFDTAAVQDAFDLNEDILPVVLVTVGYAAEHYWKQQPRKVLDDVFTLL